MSLGDCPELAEWFEWYERHRAIVTEPTRTLDERLAAAVTVLQAVYGDSAGPDVVDARSGA